jgi:hypothetical protein
MVAGAFRARYYGELQPRYELGYWGLTLSGLVLGIIELGTAVGEFGLRLSVTYMVGLYWLLAVAIFQLVMQVMATLRSLDGD